MQLDTMLVRASGQAMWRREFIGFLIGAAVTWPLATHAQQPAMPVIGFLDPRSPDALADRLRAFHRGLKDAGYIEHENVTIEYRWAENQMDRLPTLAAELVRVRVGVIISPGGIVSTLAAKQATAKIPIVSPSPTTPLGLVWSRVLPDRVAT
jgi:putative tryptophan/tyrosine transport system substrate-binding protein